MVVEGFKTPVLPGHLPLSGTCSETHLPGLTSASPPCSVPPGCNRRHGSSAHPWTETRSLTSPGDTARSSLPRSHPRSWSGCLCISQTLRSCRFWLFLHFQTLKNYKLVDFPNKWQIFFQINLTKVTIDLFYYFSWEFFVMFFLKVF